MVSKNLIRVLIVALGLLIGLPVWQLSGMLLWGVLCAATTMLILDIAMLRPYDRKVKLFFLAIYVVSMLAVVVWLLNM